jgi:hypothetical protein
MPFNVNTIRDYEVTPEVQGATNVAPLSNLDRALIQLYFVDRGLVSTATATQPSPAPTSPSTPGTGGPPVTAVNPAVQLALTTVKPGDLITADFMNNFVAALLALEVRLRTLESQIASASMTAESPPVVQPAPNQ